MAPISRAGECVKLVDSEWELLRIYVVGLLMVVYGLSLLFLWGDLLPRPYDLVAFASLLAILGTYAWLAVRWFRQTRVWLMNRRATARSDNQITLQGRRELLIMYRVNESGILRLRYFPKNAYLVLTAALWGSLPIAIYYYLDVLLPNSSDVFGAGVALITFAAYCYSLSMGFVLRLLRMQRLRNAPVDEIEASGTVVGRLTWPEVTSARIEGRELTLGAGPSNYKAGVFRSDLEPLLALLGSKLGGRLAVE